MANRKWWYQFHRIVGLYSLVFIFILALSGLVLSYSETLRLEERAVYFLDVSSLTVNSHLLQLKANKLVIDDVDTGVRCAAPIAGVVDYNLSEDELGSSPSGVMLVCQNIIYWMNWQGDVFESANVPEELRPISESYFVEQELLLKTSLGLKKWDVDLGGLAPISAALSNVKKLPQLDVDSLNLEQFILKLHTGLIAGDLGRNLMRLAAIGLLLLCFSGLKNALRKK